VYLAWRFQASRVYSLSGYCGEIANQFYLMACADFMILWRDKTSYADTVPGLGCCSLLNVPNEASKYKDAGNLKRIKRTKYP